jgi:pyrroline-5-carboxylate reductase
MRLPMRILTFVYLEDHMPDLNIAVIGIGNIGRILVRRLLIGGVPARQIVIVDADETKKQACAAEFGVRAASLVDECVTTADVLLLSPAPKAVPEVLQALSPRLRPGQIIVSFAAAIPITALEKLAPQGVRVVRVMPNAPSLLGHGMNPVAFSSQADDAARKTVFELLECLGTSIEVRDDQINWCVGLSGAAMRSLLPALEGMIQAGLEAGLSEAEARQVAGVVMQGTAALALNTDLSLEQIKALTPMQTVDEAAVAQVYLEAARSAKAKIDALQQKLAGG